MISVSGLIETVYDVSCDVQDGGCVVQFSNTIPQRFPNFFSTVPFFGRPDLAMVSGALL